MSEAAFTIQHGGDHYTKMAMQPFELSLANGYDGAIHSVNKYVSRHESKGGAEDLKKGEHICAIRAEALERLPQAEVRSFTRIHPVDYCDLNGIDGKARLIIIQLHFWSTFGPQDSHRETADYIAAAIKELRLEVYGDDGT